MVVVRGTRHRLFTLSRRRLRASPIPRYLNLYYPSPEEIGDSCKNPISGSTTFVPVAEAYRLPPQRLVSENGFDRAGPLTIRTRSGTMDENETLELPHQVDVVDGQGGL